MGAQLLTTRFGISQPSEGPIEDSDLRRHATPRLEDDSLSDGIAIQISFSENEQDAWHFDGVNQTPLSPFLRRVLIPGNPAILGPVRARRESPIRRSHHCPCVGHVPLVAADGLGV